MTTAVPLADNWSEAADRNEEAMTFLRQYGKTLQYQHTGIYRAGSGNERHYTTMPFCVFQTINGKNLEQHFLNLEFMQQLLATARGLPSNTLNDAIKSNMGKVLGKGIRDYNFHVTHLPPAAPVSPSLQKV